MNGEEAEVGPPCTFEGEAARDETIQNIDDAAEETGALGEETAGEPQAVARSCAPTYSGATQSRAPRTVEAGGQARTDGRVADGRTSRAVSSDRRSGPSVIAPPGSDPPFTVYVERGSDPLAPARRL